MKLVVAIAAAAVMSSAVFAENIVRLYKAALKLYHIILLDSRWSSIRKVDSAENGEVSQEFILDGHCHSNLAGFKGFALDAITKNVGDFEACSYGHSDPDCGPEYRPYPLHFSTEAHTQEMKKENGWDFIGESFSFYLGKCEPGQSPMKAVDSLTRK